MREDREPEVTWGADHERLAARTAATGEVSEAQLLRIWNRVAPTLTESTPAPRRRGWAVAALAVVVLGTSGMAAAEFWPSRTGAGPVDAEDLLLGGPGERLDPAGSDFAAVVRAETSDIPFPDEASRGVAVQNQVHDFRFDDPGTARVSVGAMRAWVADAAICSWSNAWAAALRDDDRAARDEAVRMILQAPSWPAVQDVDPEPFSRLEEVATEENGKITTEWVPDVSTFFYLAELGQAIEGSAPAPVAALLAQENGYCTANLVPDLPAANPLS